MIVCFAVYALVFRLNILCVYCVGGFSTRKQQQTREKKYPIGLISYEA